MIAPYILDTNFFIQAHRLYYPLDVVPSFWNKLKELSERGIVASLDKVKDEIYKNDDELKSWCNSSLHSDFFLDCSASIVKYTELITWAVGMNQHYTQKAIDEFLDAEEADAWLISFCAMANVTLVTYEVGGQGAKKKIKIPDACDVFGIRYISPIDMFRQIGERV